MPTGQPSYLSIGAIALPHGIARCLKSHIQTPIHSAISLPMYYYPLGIYFLNDIPHLNVPLPPLAAPSYTHSSPRLPYHLEHRPPNNKHPLLLPPHPLHHLIRRRRQRPPPHIPPRNSIQLKQRRTPR